MATVRKLIVEVIDARNLLPKDGHGTSSPYVILDFYGQRRKTRTVVRDLNPVWNEVVEFNVGKPSDVFEDMLELDVNHDQNIGPTNRNDFLGRVRLSSRQFVREGEEALIYYPLEKRALFSWIQGEIGLKIYFVDKIVSPPEPPTPPPPPAEEVKAEAAASPPAAAADDTAPPVSSGNPPKPSAEVSANPDAAKSETPPPPEDSVPSDASKHNEEQLPTPMVEAAEPPETAAPEETAESYPPENSGNDPAEPIPAEPVQMDPEQLTRT